MNTKSILFRGVAAASIVVLFQNPVSAETDNLDVHGFISQGFIQSTTYNFQSHESTDGSLQFNEIGINCSTDLADNIRAGIQLLSRDYGLVGNNELTVDWAYGDVVINNALGLRIGRLKAPRGLYNETRDIDLVRTGILLPQSVYDETLRDALSAVDGIELYGMLPLSAMGSLLYKVQVGPTTINAKNSGIRLAYAERGLSVDEITTDTGGILALEWLTPLDGLRLGATVRRAALVSTDETPLGNIDLKLPSLDIYTLSAEYLRGDWLFNAEYQHMEDVIEITAPAGVPLPPTLTMENQGWYIGAAYRVNDLLELGSYYSFYDDIAWGLETHDVALSSRFDLSPHWTVKLEGHILNGGTSYINSSVEPDKDQADGDNWMLFLMKTTFSF